MEKFLKPRNWLQAYAYCVEKIDDNAFLQQYQIAEVPRFMVLLPNGDILSTKFFGRPTDNDFIESLNDLLNRVNIYYTAKE